MSLLSADCPVDRSTGAEPSLKSHADHSCHCFSLRHHPGPNLLVEPVSKHAGDWELALSKTNTENMLTSINQPHMFWLVRTKWKQLKTSPNMAIHSPAVDQKLNHRLGELSVTSWSQFGRTPKEIYHLITVSIILPSLLLSKHICYMDIN